MALPQVEVVTTQCAVVCLWAYKVIKTYLCIPECVGSPRFINKAYKTRTIEFVKALRIKYEVRRKTSISQHIKSPIPKRTVVHIKLVHLVLIWNRNYINLKLDKLHMF